MASSPVVRLLGLLIVCLIALCSPKANAVTCNEVMNDLSPCVPYIVNGGAVAAPCCNGVRSLFGQAQTTPDRRTVCSCIKNAIRNIPYNNNNLNLAASLPKKCGINLPYQISPNIDCSRVQ